MTTKRFMKLLKEEIETIKLKATSEEKSLLETDKLDITSPTNCIYGLMTGHCNSVRANQLWYKSLDTAGLICSTPIKNFPEVREYTVLEIYLHKTRQTTAAHIVAYIKGEIELLILPLPKNTDKPIYW